MTALLILIYIAFISLGIPDSLLGSAWPAMHTDLAVSVSAAGLLSTVVCLGTIVSGILSAKMIARFGTARVTAVSVLLTALAMLGISQNRSFAVMVLLCVPLGLGGGAIDAALNNFVALHYHAKHMNWLHCFWGLGATLGPVLIGAVLSRTGRWDSGYLLIGGMQCALAAVMLASMPLWKRAGGKAAEGGKSKQAAKPLSLRQIARLPRAFPVFLTLFAYCGAENTMNLWGASYLVEARGVAVGTAASWVSLFFLGVTGGRFLAGFLSKHLTNPQLVRLGISVSAAGVLLLLLPLPLWTAPAAYLIIGLGFAPIFPAVLHQTPKTFGESVSQSVMGVQMAFAYVGGMLTPLLLGWLGKAIGMWILPIYVALPVVLMLCCWEYVNRKVGG